MSSLIFYGRQVAEFTDMDRRMVKAELREAGSGTDVEIDFEELSGETDIYDVILNYQWEIEKDDNSFLLTEEIYIDLRWFHLFLGSFFVASTLLLLASLKGLVPIFNMIGLGFGIVFLIMFGSAFAVLTQIPEVVPKTRGANEGIDTYQPHFYPLIIIGAMMIVFAIGQTLNLDLLTFAPPIASYLVLWKYYRDEGELDLSLLIV